MLHLFVRFLKRGKKRRMLVIVTPPCRVQYSMRQALVRGPLNAPFMINSTASMASSQAQLASITPMAKRAVFTAAIPSIKRALGSGDDMISREES